MQSHVEKLFIETNPYRDWCWHHKLRFSGKPWGLCKYSPVTRHVLYWRFLNLGRLTDARNSAFWYRTPPTINQANDKSWLVTAGEKWITNNKNMVIYGNKKRSQFKLSYKVHNLFKCITDVWTIYLQLQTKEWLSRKIRYYKTSNRIKIHKKLKYSALGHRLYNW